MENSSSSCTTPASLRPLSPGLFDHLAAEDDENNDLSFLSSPGSKRCPTFKEYSEKIRKLQQENFQLRVRIYLSEQQSGVKSSATDLGALYGHLQTLYGNGTGSRSGNLAILPHSTVQTSTSTTSLSGRSGNNELENIKADKKLKEKLKTYEESLAYKDRKISELSKMVEELSRKNEEFLSELAESNSTIQKLNEDLSNARKSEEERVENMAYLAFGQNEEVQALNQEWESKVHEKSEEISLLQSELERACRKLESAEKKVEGIKMYELKVHEMSEALKEMGRKCARTERLNEKLFKKLNEQVTSDLDSMSVNMNQDPERLNAIQHLMGMLQSRVKELTNFVETLLHLEAKKVVTLTGFTNENRENLKKVIEQCRMFGEKLEEIFEKGNHHCSGSSSRGHQAHSHGRHRHQSSSTDLNYRMFSPVSKLQRTNSETQCNILDPTVADSLEAANAYISRLKHDISTLEKLNTQLTKDKTDLISHVKSLESSVNVLRMANKGEATIESSKIKEENKQLLKRLSVAEETLRNLHVQHANLVGELKSLKSSNLKQTSKTSVGSTVIESTRPSDSTSPDLGIDSGHDGAINSDDSAATNYKEENRILRTSNRELALKLKQTRQALDITIEKLNTATKEKEQVEKAICRQLHKTHTILRQAKKSVEKFTNSQCQENIQPSTP